MAAVQATLAAAAKSGDEALREQAAELTKGAAPELPAELQRKSRKGMSAKSPYGQYRGVRRRTVRLGRATGPGSYAEESPQQIINRERERAAARFAEAHV